MDWKSEAALVCGLFSGQTSLVWMSVKRDLRIQERIDLFLRRRKLLSDRARLGQWGEKRAERLLARKGFKTLARHVSCKSGELDLVMVDLDGTLVFVEVKTRADEGFAPAEAAITPAKRRRLARAARYFVICHDLHDYLRRFDVVTIVLGRTGRPEIRHYENAFVP